MDLQLDEGMDGFSRPGWPDQAGSAAGPSGGRYVFVPHGGPGPANFDGFGNSVLSSGQAGFEAPGGKDLHRLLAQRLGPEYVATRAGPGGGKLNYLEGCKAIELINEVIGFNNWRNEVRQVDIDVVDQDETSGKWTVGVSVTVRITLRDGSFREDIGCGKGENQKSKLDAVEKAKKEAVTDALKRVMRLFGNLFGNCLYDKNYLSDIGKMKVPAKPRYFPNQLYPACERQAEAAAAHPPKPAPVPAPEPVKAATTPVRPVAPAPATASKPAGPAKAAAPLPRRDTFPPQPHAIQTRASVPARAMSAAAGLRAPTPDAAAASEVSCDYELDGDDSMYNEVDLSGGAVDGGNKSSGTNQGADDSGITDASEAFEKPHHPPPVNRPAAAPPQQRHPPPANVPQAAVLPPPQTRSAQPSRPGPSNPPVQAGHLPDRRVGGPSTTAAPPQPQPHRNWQQQQNNAVNGPSDLPTETANGFTAGQQVWDRSRSDQNLVPPARPIAGHPQRGGRTATNLFANGGRKSTSGPTVLATSHANAGPRAAGGEGGGGYGESGPQAKRPRQEG